MSADKHACVVRAIAIAVVAIVFIPYTWGYFNTLPGMVYMGFPDHPYDQNSYLSRIQQASEGKFFIRRDFTLEEQRPLFFNPFTWTLGIVARYSRLSPLAVYYGALVFYTLLLFYVIYWFIGFFIEDQRERTFAFALCAFSSGLCWVIPDHQWEMLFSRLNIVPIDYWIAETITFETIFSFPQFALTAALMLLGFGFLLRALRGRLLVNSIYGGLSLVALSFVHTVDMVTITVVMVTYCITVYFKYRHDAARVLASSAVIALVALPAFLYMLYLFRTEPVFIEWSKEKFLSPHPLSYVIGYGIVLFIAMPELAWIFRRGNRDDWLLAVWVIAVAILLYAPLSFQRRLSTAVHVPLCILAARGTFRYLLPACSGIFIPVTALDTGKRRHVEAIILVLIFLMTTPSNIVKVMSCITDMKTKPLEFYLYEGDVAAMRWMKENNNEDAAVISSYKSGLYLPAYTGNRVYVGHWSETLRFTDKARLADWVLYGPRAEREKREFLKANGISYIYFGNFERMKGPFSLETAGYLEKIYDGGGVSIYRVAK
ncbi:MAG: hypothetical protein NTX71_08885 [Candidatus Aureabacteria bacterium]|nr:hypothetical protein [Candidatus Auribacterota bacterium]